MAISNPVTIGSASGLSAFPSVGLTTTALVPSGGKIFFFVYWFDVATTLSSVSDGSAYRIEHQGGTSSNNFAVCSRDAAAGLASGSTITATFSGNTGNIALSGGYSTGVSLGAGYSPVGQGQTVNTAWSSTAITVASGDILIGGSHWEDSTSATNTASGGNTELHDFTTGTGSAYTSCYQLGTGASIAASGTWSATSSTTRSGVIAFAAAAAAGGSHASFEPIPFIPLTKGA